MTGLSSDTEEHKDGNLLIGAAARNTAVAEHRAVRTRYPVLSRTILGASSACVATHPSDMCVALAALDAVVRLQGAGGTRTLPLTELYRHPGDHREIETFWNRAN
ncbi:FAD binding domain-containing protein [Streptomyces sp. LZ34]